MVLNKERRCVSNLDVSDPDSGRTKVQIVRIGGKVHLTKLQGIYGQLRVGIDARHQRLKLPVSSAQNLKL